MLAAWFYFFGGVFLTVASIILLVSESVASSWFFLAGSLSFAAGTTYSLAGALT